MHIAGIDPGMSGGWAILSIGEGLPMLFNGGRMPVLKQGSKTLVNAVALWDGLSITQVRHRNYLVFGVRQLPLSVEGNPIAGAQVAQASRLFCRGRYLGRCNVHEVFLQLVEFHVSCNDSVGETECHFLRASTGRDKTYPYFHQTHVQFGMCLNVVCMKGKFTSTT